MTAKIEYTLSRYFVFIRSTCITAAFFLGHELAIRLLGNRLVDSLGFFELGPKIKVGLRLVMSDGVGIILLLLGGFMKRAVHGLGCAYKHLFDQSKS